VLLKPEGCSIRILISSLSSDCTNQVEASFRAAIRSPANGISGVCASGSVAAPPSQGTHAVAPPSAARFACESVGDYRESGSLHAALRNASANRVLPTRE